MLGVDRTTISRWERKSLEKIEENQKDKLEKH
jgi:hypothetical protein